MQHRQLSRTSRWKSGAAAGGAVLALGGALAGLRLTLAAPSAARAASEPHALSTLSSEPDRPSAPATDRPRPGASAADDRLVDLGRRAFFDATLSDPPGTSCASCHDPAHAFAGNNGSRTGVARGSRPDHFARRNTPSVLYLKFVPRFHFHWEEDVDLPDGVGGFFWDGRSDSIASLVRQPLFNPDEMNARDPRQVRDKLVAGPYADELRGAFGAALDEPEATVAALGSAIEAFLRSDSMAPFSSKYDDYVRRHVELTELEAQGLRLFKDRAKGACDACHRLNEASPVPERSLFTDYGFEAVGAPRNRASPPTATRRTSISDSASDTTTRTWTTRGCAGRSARRRYATSPSARASCTTARSRSSVTSSSSTRRAGRTPGDGTRRARHSTICRRSTERT